MVKFTIGDKSPLPALKKNFESENIKNLFVIGSLSGIPLIKNAINQGKDVIDEIKPNSIKKEADFDLIIVGGGPGGVTAAIEAKKKGLNYILLEKGRLFEIVHQYPNKKPIYAEPHELKVTGDLNFEDKPKEKLLEDLAKKIKKNPINIIENNPVSDIKKKGDLFFIKSKNKNYTSEFVILSIGDLGSPRKLKISGEDLDIVSHKLDNPDKYFDKKILVVGGGNSAIEAAIALSEKNKVILSYRQDSFFRCTKKNKDLLQNMIASKDVDIILNSSLKNIKHTHVEIDIKGKVAKKDFDKIFILIGFEPSLSFMEKINIKLEKSYGLKDIFGFLIIGFIALWVYTYNKGVTEISNLFNSSLVGEIINLNNISNPFNIWSIVLFLILIVNIIYIVYAGIKSIKKIGQKNYTILIGLIIIIWIFSGVTFIYNYLRTGILFNTGGAFWPYYTLLYSLIVTSFGFMSLLKYKKKYIWDRTLALIYSQTILLFLLPVFIFKDWRVFSLVYVWPLGPDALTNTYVVEGSILGFLSNGFFMWLGIILSFVGFSILVYYKGRGAVCSWFCGCGALAETLGDPFRKKTPQGKSAKWLEYSSYFLFGFAAIVTILKAFRNTMLPVVFAISFFTLFFMWFSYRKIKNNIIPISIFIGLIFGYVLDIIIIKYGGSSFTLYKYFADFTLAGWVAVAAYFFIGGRIWCRYFCPLISYLGIISSIGRFKIRPNPDKCISCGLCTRNCHMGIDVMNYAQKGHDMKEPSCVGCGICVEVCPMDLFNVVTDNKTIGPGTSYQIKANPNKLKIIDFQKSSFEKNNISNSSKLNKFQVLAMGGKPEATKTLMAARAKMIKGMKSKTLKVLK